ncbi:threonine/homoserine/homoserine lactone efflux protein [Herbihabitans rhizosphaerae]|uniref:Threonine/homoserine/homoserine lactone efflux protein n=1 Tax=Herbihabitans rhizosphaerae TaxID=1872711 RepID=A0A4Q7KY74_9PSEU|nr:LysE family translocator [Herbihabitans rhizosphaerae]RZS40971.1 threonine/homoserine/homoserine lactone efflux protein [Herbihabitans rhizosphaerae]
MPDTTTLAAFLAATVALVAIPGPNLLYIVACSVSGGRKAGVVSALGVETGTLVHVLLAVAGLSTVVSQAPVVLAVIKYAGAAYLVYLGVRAILAARSATEAHTVTPPPGLFRSFVDGMLVNLLNPKVILFFLAFLPQFTGPSPSRASMLLLGVIFFAVALVMDLAYAFLGGLLKPTASQWPNRIAATVYIGLAGYAVIA